MRPQPVRKTTPVEVVIQRDDEEEEPTPTSSSGVVAQTGDEEEEEEQNNDVLDDVLSAAIDEDVTCLGEAKGQKKRKRHLEEEKPMRQSTRHRARPLVFTITPTKNIGKMLAKWKRHLVTEQEDKG